MYKKNNQIENWKTKNRAAVGAMLLSALVTFAVYLPSLGNGFVNWDDPTYIYKNPMIKSLDVAFVKWAFTSVVSGNWHPLTLFSHALDYAVFGPSPFGHHLSALIIHTINTALVFLLSFKLIGTGGRFIFYQRDGRTGRRF